MAMSDVRLAALGNFGAVVIIGTLLWNQIGGVGTNLNTLRGEVATFRTEVGTFRTEVATYRTGDAKRIDTVSTRLDGIFDSLSVIRGSVDKATSKIATLLGVENEVKDAQRRIASTGSDVLVIFRLMAGEPANLPLIQMVAGQSLSEPARKVAATLYVRGKIVADKLTLFPEDPQVKRFLMDSGWRPAKANNLEAGLVLR